MVPSSPFLERRLVRAARLDRVRTVIEIGPGTGGTTQALLKVMRRDARLLAIEHTAEFIDTLGDIDDSRLTVVHGCASMLLHELKRQGLGSAEVIISGIPFSTLPKELAQQVVTTAFQALPAGGRFVAYQLSDRVNSYATPHFGKPTVEAEMLNIPPLRVFIWEKAGQDKNK